MIFAIRFVKPILQIITHLIQYTVWDIQVLPVKCPTAFLRYSKILSISIPSHEAMRSHSNCIVSIVSIILLLKKPSLIKVFSKKSQIGMNLWMFILATWKALDYWKDRKKVNVLCVVDRHHERYVIVLDHFSNFKDIWLIVEYSIENEEGILIRGIGKYCSKLKTESWKLKSCYKLLGILDEQEPSVQSADRMKASLKSRNYIFTKTWKVAVTASISENK